MERDSIAASSVPYHLIHMTPTTNLHCAECVFMSFEVEVPGVLPMDLGIAYTLFRALIDPKYPPTLVTVLKVAANWIGLKKCLRSTMKAAPKPMPS